MSGAGYLRRDGRVVYENPWLRFEAYEIVHPNGHPGEHGLVVTASATGVVVLDGEDVILTRQPRFAIDAMVIEIAKGGAEPGEELVTAAQRELREELGLIAARWDSLGMIHELPSIVREPLHLFLARDLRAVAAEPEAHESIEAVRMPFADALKLAAAGGIDDAVTGLALLRASHHLSLGE